MPYILCTRRDAFVLSFHEIGVYDMPALINYVLNATGQEELFYVGYSQGTTAFFALAAERPEFNKHIKLMVALAPVAYLSNTRQPLVRALAPLLTAGVSNQLKPSESRTDPCRKWLICLELVR